MKNSTKKTLAAMLSIALLLALVVFLSLGRHSGTTTVEREAAQRAAPLLPSELVTDQKHEEQPEEQSAIFGLVEDEGGNPIAGALVKALETAAGIYDYEAFTRTADDGTYSLSGLDLGNECSLIASAPGFVSSDSGEFLFDESPREINFILARMDSAPEEEPEEPETIIEGVQASIDRFRSGRIVYTIERVRAPRRDSEEDIEKQVKRQEGLFRADPLMSLDEEEIQDLLERERKNLRESTRGRERKWSRSGEYIFEGKNSYQVFVIPATDEMAEHVFERYVYENKMTTFTTNGREITATIKTGLRDGCTDFRSPLYSFTDSVLYYLSAREWKVSGSGQADGEVAYTLYSEFFNMDIDVVPERGYYVKEYRLSRPHTGFSATTRYAKMRWDPVVGAYYPAEIREERHNKKGPAPEWSTKTIFLEEVEFNRDYDDSIFEPVFKEGTRIIDNRFDPPKSFTYQHPDFADEYLAQLDEEARQIEEEKKGRR